MLPDQAEASAGGPGGVRGMSARAGTGLVSRFHIRILGGACWYGPSDGHADHLGLLVTVDEIPEAV